MRVGGYVRVSTQEQAKEGYSIGAQTERLKAYCVARGWTMFEVYTDPAYSGAKMERPALQKLIADVKKKKLDLVLVYKLDRLSRSQKDTLYLIEDIFMKNNVAFVSLNENFDTSTAFGRAMVGILSVFAQLEREQIKERTQMGRVERAKEGLWKGGGVVPVGYDYIVEKNELRVNEYEAMQVRDIFDMYVNKGYAIAKIQRVLEDDGYTKRIGDWRHPKSVRYILGNPIYAGLITWEGETYQGKHQPIISEELFIKAKQKLEARQWKDKLPPEFSPFTATQLLTGILYCRHCGGRYFGAGAYRGSKKLPYSQRNYIHIYTCYSRAKTKKEMIKDPNCRNKNWRADELDAMILSEIRKFYTDNFYFDDLVASTKPPESKEDVLQKRIADLDIQISKMLDLYQYKDIPTAEIANRLEALTKEKTSLEDQLDSSEQEEPSLSIEQARVIIENAKSVLDSGTFEERRNLVHSLIKRIEIDNNDVYITWRFL